MATTNASLRDVFRAADITAVLWIDDKFDTADGELDTVTLREVTATAIAAGILPTHAALSDLTLEMNAEQWAAAIEELAERDRDTAREAFTALEKQTFAIANDVTADYNEDELNAIFASFEDIQVERVGREKWLAEKENLKARVTADTLVLVDREFRIEGVVSNLGNDILREFATLAIAANVVMLTHSYTREQAAEATEVLAQELDIDRTKFAVMSKHRTPGGAPDTEKQLRSALRVALTQRACVELARMVATEIEDEIKKTFHVLSSESVFELDQAVFENSLKVGASELDVIARLFMLRQRVRAQTMFGTSEVSTRELRRIRKLRELEGLPPMAKREPSTRLLDWRRDEVFDPAERVNPVRSPLRSGDVFQCGSAVSVLLAQDCDMVVRDNGSRSATEGFFVRARQLENVSQDGTSSERRENNQRYYELPAFVDRSRWRLDFCLWAAVNLCCLDLAVFKVPQQNLWIEAG